MKQQVKYAETRACVRCGQPFNEARKQASWRAIAAYLKQPDAPRLPLGFLCIPCVKP